MKITNRKAREFVQQLKEFKANNLTAYRTGNVYAVLSYGYWPLFVYLYDSGIWLENQDRYSVTTSKHRSQSHPLVFTDTVSRETLDKLIYEANAESLTEIRKVG